jgi:hypothetical protein
MISPGIRKLTFTSNTSVLVEMNKRSKQFSKIIARYRHLLIENGYGEIIATLFPNGIEHKTRSAVPARLAGHRIMS